MLETADGERGHVRLASPVARVCRHEDVFDGEMKVEGSQRMRRGLGVREETCSVLAMV